MLLKNSPNAREAIKMAALTFVCLFLFLFFVYGFDSLFT